MSATQKATENISLLYDVPVQLSVELGNCNLPMRQVLQLKEGSVVQLDSKSDSPVSLSVNDKRIAWGEVVVVDNKFGIKITKMV